MLEWMAFDIQAQGDWMMPRLPKLGATGMLSQHLD